MKKRVLSLLLAVVLTVGLLPMKAEAVTEAQENAIRTAVTKVIKNFSKSVYRANADDDAFWQFFNHGFYGNGKTLVLTERDAFVSSLFNSCLMQEALIEGITKGITISQTLGADTIRMSPGASWHNFYCEYGFNAFLGDTPISDAYLELAVNSYENDTGTAYTGPQNENDEIMHMLVGGLEGGFTLYRETVTDDTMVYRIVLDTRDRFDFDMGGYDYAGDQGHSTAKDDRLVKIGIMLTYMGLDEFDWSFTKELRVEVPNPCRHSNGQYQWDYDVETDTINNVTELGFDSNLCTRQSDAGTSASDFMYFTLDEPVHLRYDRPWVIEYDLIPGMFLCMSPLERVYGCLPYFLQSGRTGTYWRQYDFADDYVFAGETLNGKEFDFKAILDNVLHTVGSKISASYTSNSKHGYHGVVENVPTEGTNIIMYSVVDDTTGEVVYGPEPMDDHWALEKGGSASVQQIPATRTLSGKDFVIGCISGEYSSEMSNSDFTVKIYENGKDGSGASTFDTFVKSPTCTEQGGVVHTCRDCGYSYMTEPVAAKGHSFGEYAYNNNASCTADGTQTRTCTVCGEKETITAGGTAKGHSYNAVVTAPTLTAEGYTTYTCAVCGDSYKADFVAKKEHKYVGVTTEPTCTEQGYTTYTCSECGDSYVDNYTEIIYHTPVIDPYVAPTCVEKGKTEGSHCGVCGYVIKKQANISTVDRHDYEEEITKIPTYEEDGEVTYTCKDCGKTEVKTIPAFEKPTPTNPFTDVKDSDWFYQPVMWALENNVTGGTSETTFGPYDSCTRAQVVTFLWAANGKPEPKSMDNPFSDVSDNAWYLKPVLWAVEQGITGGVAEGKFGPEQTCTRAQIATFLYAEAGKPEVSGSSTFKDVTNDAWYARPVIWAVENDVTSGIGNGKFGPNDTCTRAQVVTFLKKVYG